MKQYLRAKASEKLESIIQHYLSSDFLSSSNIGNSISMMNGISGILILLLYSQKISPIIDAQILIKLFEKIQNTIEKQQLVPATFANGLAGVGIVIVKLKEDFPALYDEINQKLSLDDFLNELDDFLEDKLSYALRSKRIDLFHGAMGIGLYFIKRKNKKNISDIVNLLFAMATINNREIKWSRYDESNTSHEFIYDFGLAHGNAGILYFLGKCYNNHIEKEKSRYLINGLFNFFTNNINLVNKAFDPFPFSISVKEYKKRNTSYKSRLAWCTGYLGILHTILLVSKWTKNYTSFSFAKKILLQVADKRGDDFLADAQFCHGMGGLAYMFLSFYRITKMPELKIVIKHWIEQLLIDGNKTDGISGYSFKMGEPIGWHKNESLLHGIGGVAFSLLAYVQMNKIPLDEIFFLS